MWQQTSTGLGREDGGAVVLITNLWAPHLFLLCLSSLLACCQKMKVQAMCRCLWCGLVLEMWKYNCAVLSLTSGAAGGFVQNFWINQEEIPVLFLLGEAQREYVSAYFEEVRRWGEERDAWKSAGGYLFTLEQGETKRALPYFSPASPVSNTFAPYQWTSRTKCAQGKEIKIAKQFPFLSTELTEKWQNACGND